MLKKRIGWEACRGTSHDDHNHYHNHLQKDANHTKTKILHTIIELSPQRHDSDEEKANKSKSLI